MHAHMHQQDFGRGQESSIVQDKRALKMPQRQHCTKEGDIMRVLCLVICVSLWMSCITSYSATRNPQIGTTSKSSLLSRKVCETTVGPACVDGSEMKSSGLTRRNVMSLSCFSFVSVLGITQQAQAACLFGDTSADCIGVYKMPMDDAALPYVNTPEKLRLNAPDLRWVAPVEYPKTYKSARAELNPLQQRCLGLDAIVLRGNLTEAGTELLSIVPRLTVAGRVVISSLRERKDMSMKAYRAEVAHVELLNKLGEADVLIGQAISGQLGAMAPAQLQILSELRDANELFDEFLRSVPHDFDGSDAKKR